MKVWYRDRRVDNKCSAYYPKQTYDEVVANVQKYGEKGKSYYILRECVEDNKVISSCVINIISL